MSGALSDEKFYSLKRISRQFGYRPTREDVWCLIATVEKLQEEKAALIAQLEEAPNLRLGKCRFDSY